MTGAAERIFQKFIKVKYPTLGLETDEYVKLRHAFFVGVWATFGLAETVTRHQGPVGDSMIRDLKQEAEAILRPDKHPNITDILKTGGNGGN